LATVANPFDELVAELDDALYLVTAASGGEADGCLVGFATRCSISPARFLVCLSKPNRTTRLALRCDTIVVHLLHRDDREIAVRFGGATGDEVDKLADCRWTPGPGGAPVLDGLDWFAGQVVARHDVGDHIAHVLAVLPDGASARAAEPLLGSQAIHGLTPGHEP
jgi:flavin reductase (DIM6/NTAB) family NADH-FMN oxidoreductase RutF